jgi:hypothetical protein
MLAGSAAAGWAANPGPGSAKPAAPGTTRRAPARSAAESPHASPASTAPSSSGSTSSRRARRAPLFAAAARAVLGPLARGGGPLSLRELDLNTRSAIVTHMAKTGRIMP